MRTGFSLRPGQGGTKRHLAQRGEHLVCVRYRYGEKLKKRFNTIEAIVEETYREPERRAFRAEEIVGLRVYLKETELQNGIRKDREIRYDRTVELGLEERVVSQEAYNSRGR